MKKMVLSRTILCLFIVILMGCAHEKSLAAVTHSIGEPQATSAQNEYPVSENINQSVHVLIEDDGFGDAAMELIYEDGSYYQYAGTENVFNYAAFLELLAMNGFEFEEAGFCYAGNQFAGAGGKVVYVGNEQLIVFGQGVAHPDMEIAVQITWGNEVLWSNAGSTFRVVYLGGDETIIAFLDEIFIPIDEPQAALTQSEYPVSENINQGVHVLIEDDGYGDAAMELIYEDDYYRYYLTSVRSHRIMLTFENGLRNSLNEAIFQQKITIPCLIMNGLHFMVIPKNGMEDVFNYAAFLELLDMNGFEFEEAGFCYAGNRFASAGGKVVYVGDEQLIVFGQGVAHPDMQVSVQITWGNEVLWLNAGSTFRVVYLGEDETIIAFLNQTFVQ